MDQAEGFTCPSDALAWLDENEADAALLDIDMPEMSGLALAAKIKEKYPDISVVFTTGYAQFAVDAFALHASGYLMKPLSKERIDEELRYARNEIVARYGRIFKTKVIRDYFVAKAWYTPLYQPEEFDAMQESLLNEYEKANLALINKIEKERADAKKTTP